MSQQPQDLRTPAQKILDFYRHHGFFTSDRATCNELTRLDDENKSLRAQVERLQAAGQVVAPTVEAAHEMGAHGGPVVEAERLAFEAWMSGHCWKVSPTWSGKEYDDSEGDKKRKLLDPLARTTRMLWAAWRDRAALQASRQPVQQAVAEGAGDGELLDALARPGWELSMNDDPECHVDELWQVHRVSGGRNDREWTLIGQGETHRAAIAAALATKERS